MTGKLIGIAFLIGWLLGGASWSLFKDLAEKAYKIK